MMLGAKCLPSFFSLGEHYYFPKFWCARASIVDRSSGSVLFLGVRVVAQ